ncbi:MAG: hypothetical protein ACKO22_13565 [Cyanobium sp.]
MALAFAAGARRPGADETLLGEWTEARRRLMEREARLREKHRLWTLNQKFDDYYREIGPQEEDLTGPDPQDPRP